MDVKVNDVSETKKELEVTLSAEEMKGYTEKTAQKLSSEMNIKGFRPGNVPQEVVENTVGKEKLYEEAAREAIQETYPKIIEEKKLYAVANPHVDIVKCAPGNEVVYKAVVYVMPEIDLPDYKKIAEDTVKKEKKEVKVEDKEIEDTLNRIREEKAKLQKVEREAKSGDVVNINFESTFGGDESKKVEEKDFRVNLGNNELAMLEGFEENLLGMKEGESKSFSVKAPQMGGGDQSGDKQEIDFNVEMVSVMEKELPELDDELAGSIPNIENLDQLKDKIKEGVKKEKSNKENERIKVKVLENIKKKTSFEVPEVLIEKELDNMVENTKNQVTQRGGSFEDYLKEIGKSEEELREEWKKKAQENVGYALILHTISQKEDIQVTPEEIESEVDKHFRATGRNKEEEKEENLQRMRSYVHDVIKNQKVFRVLSIEDI